METGTVFPRHCEHGDCTIVVAFVTIVGALGESALLRIRSTENRAHTGDPTLFICRAHRSRPKMAHRRIYAYADVELTETAARLHVLCEEPGGGLFVMADETGRAYFRQGEKRPGPSPT